MSLDLYLQFIDEDLLDFSRTAWESVFTYLGGPSYNSYAHEKYYRLTGDRRFLYEYLSQRVMDERRLPKEGLATLARRRRMGAWNEERYCHQSAIVYFLDS